MARTVKRFAMLPATSLVLSFAALTIVLGWLPLATGIWPGITLGIFGALAGILGRRGSPPSSAARTALGAGIALGALSAVLGVLIYFGLILAAGRLG